MIRPGFISTVEISVPPIIIFLIAVIVIIYLWRKTKQSIDLPNKWFWDLSRTRDYQKTKSDPITFYKIVESDSKEQKYLDSLIVKLDFGTLEILKSYAIVSRVLANETFVGSDIINHI